MARSNFTSKVSEPGITPRRQTILLVEEDDSVRAIAALILEREGYAVLLTSNAREALKTWEAHSHRIEVLLTDVNMAGMGGAKLAEILLALNPRLIVLFSSGGCPQTMRSLVAGRENTGFLAKPYTLSQLKLSVETAFRRSQTVPAGTRS